MINDIFKGKGGGAAAAEKSGEELSLDHVSSGAALVRMVSPFSQEERKESLRVPSRCMSEKEEEARIDWKGRGRKRMGDHYSF